MRTALAVLAAGLLVQAAHAFVPIEGAAMPECRALRVVLVHENGRERLILQARYVGDGAAFTYVVPVPTPVAAGSVRLADSDALATIDDYTSPRIIRYIEDEQPGCVCANLDAIMPTGDTEVIADPPLWESTTEDGYGIRALSDVESSAIGETLASLRYEPTMNDRSALEAYAGEGWRFVLVEVTPDDAFAGAPHQEEGGGYDLLLHAVEVSFDSPTAVLPLRGLLGGNAACDVVLLGVMANRAGPSGHTTVDMDTAGLQDADDPAQAYTERLASLIGPEDDPAWVTEYAETLRYDLAGALDLTQSRMRWLTRLRTSARADAAGRDLQLVSSPSNDRLTIVLYVPLVRRAYAAVPILLGGGIGAAIGGPGRRRRCGVLAALLALVALA